MTPLMLDLHDNAAVVTGAGSGIGVAIARALKSGLLNSGPP
jgi:NADP-dependent 3-hydroxy acid dehydrogenase YdfG